MRASPQPTVQQDDQPPPSVELDALRLMVEAYIEAEGRKKGHRLLVAAADILRRRDEDERTIVDLLAPKENERRAKMRRQTKAWFRTNLPIWIARLDAG